MTDRPIDDILGDVNQIMHQALEELELMTQQLINADAHADILYTKIAELQRENTALWDMLGTDLKP